MFQFINSEVNISAAWYSSLSNDSQFDASFCKRGILKLERDIGASLEILSLDFSGVEAQFRLTGKLLPS